MADEFLGHELEEWYPMEPQYGPPLPRFLNIYWPWYKGVAPPPVVYTCPYCGATFATEAEMNYHIQTQHAAPPIYTCPYCGATFATEAERDAHVQTQHPAPPGLANLYGRVTDKTTGAPLDQVTVALNGQVSFTADDGTYLYAEITPGDHNIYFSKNGYTSLQLQITLAEGNNELSVQMQSIAPPPPPTGQLLDLGDIGIYGANGKRIIEVGQEADGTPYGVQESPYSASNLLQTVLQWRNKNLVGTPPPADAGNIGVWFRVGFIPTFEVSPDFYAPHLSNWSEIGTPPQDLSTSLSGFGIVGGGRGSWIPGIYDGDFIWGVVYQRHTDVDVWETVPLYRGSFRIKNMVNCTGSGSI